VDISPSLLFLQRQSIEEELKDCVGYGEALRSSDLGLVKSWIASPEGMAEWKQVRIGFTKRVLHVPFNVIHIQCHSFLPFTMFHIQCHGRVEARM
jgi:hypothetical protein